MTSETDNDTTKYITTTSDNTIKINDNNLKEKNEFDKHVQKIKQYTEKRKTCRTKLTGMYGFRKKLSSSDIYKCENDETENIKKERKETFNKLYKYYKNKLTKKVLKTDNLNNKIIKKINKYTKILSEIYDECNGNNSGTRSTNNPYITENISREMTYKSGVSQVQPYKDQYGRIIQQTQQSQSQKDYKDFYELNTAYVNYIYKKRSDPILVINTLNKITNLSRAFVNTINKITETELCK